MNGTYICDYCYAGKGCYLFQGPSISQAAHLAWAKKAVRDGSFVDQMTSAIAFLNAPEIRPALSANNISSTFFRIHDSGDFFDARYYAAWLEVCQNLPGVRFWAPTRLWALRGRMDMFLKSDIPKNLSLRPSALIYGAQPPRIDGFAAGTGSDPKGIPNVMPCPAYEHKGKSCHSAKCRLCWVSPKKEVFYRTH
jgi:hypothetical protein